MKGAGIVSSSSFGAPAWGLAVIRIVVGVVMLAHGLQKIVVMGVGGFADFVAGVGLPLPLLSAILVIGTEVLGGLALIVGLYTHLAAIPIAVTMLVAMTVVHLPNGFFLPNGGEYTLTLFAAAVGLALAGPGALALDSRRTAPAGDGATATRPLGRAA